MSGSPAESCQGVLDSFLRDMEALERQQTRQPSPSSSPQPRKRSREALASESGSNEEKKKRTPSWLTRKRELQSLRQQVQVLETQFLCLQMHNAAQHPQSATMNEQARQKWKVVVEREKQQLKAAGEENERIKASVRWYAEQTRRLQSVLQVLERQRAEVLRSLATSPSALRVEMQMSLHLQPGAAMIFNMLEGDIDKRFQDLSPSLPTLCAEAKDSISMDFVQAGGRVEFERRHLLPFEEGAISSVLWSFVKGGHIPDGNDSRVVVRSQNAFAVTTQTTIQLEGGGAIHLNSLGVFKRFETARGCLVMIEGTAEYELDLPNSGQWSHSSRDRGYFLTQPFGDTSMTYANTSMDIQPSNFLMTTRKRYPAATPNVLTDSVLPVFQKLFNSRSQFVENALFDRIRSRS